MKTNEEKSTAIAKIVSDSLATIDSTFNYDQALELARHGFKMKSTQVGIVISTEGGVVSAPVAGLGISKRERGELKFHTEGGELVANFNFSALLTQQARFQVHAYSPVV